MTDSCKYCNNLLEDLHNEGLQCESCEKYVHLSCLKRGSTPGAFAGDVFFTFTCLECSDTDTECFSRENTKWFHILVLTFYHLNVHNKPLSRKGFYHWRMHVATFIDKNWNVLFDKSCKQKRNWMGTISGLLSVNSSTFFTRCRTFTEQGWWTLTYPKLTPHVQVKLSNELASLKLSLKSQNIFESDTVLLADILKKSNISNEFTIMTISLPPLEHIKTEDSQTIDDLSTITPINDNQTNLNPNKTNNKQKRALLPTFDSISMSDLDTHGPLKKKQKLNHSLTQSFDETATSSSQESTDSKESILSVKKEPTIKLLDPMCHYNTSLNNLFMLKRLNLKTKLLGGLREEPILSPYSNLYLKPYIHRDVKKTPHWLKIMAQIQLKANEKCKNYVLPSRSSIDYVYVQPSHIPAINSLCNQFFWPGIDLTECLQYPDFSCVVLYKKLIVGFAFIVPDVKVHENYISFIFVRPGWRNIGVGKFMIYHLIQTSMGKDITLHVAINNPGLFLYQKFGFKVEHVELNFYEKYLRNDSFESKHAFFCRLER